MSKQIVETLLDYFPKVLCNEIIRYCPRLYLVLLINIPNTYCIIPLSTPEHFNNYQYNSHIWYLEHKDALFYFHLMSGEIYGKSIYRSSEISTSKKEDIISIVNTMIHKYY